jgi:hypothetical protein
MTETEIDPAAYSPKSEQDIVWINKADCETDSIAGTFASGAVVDIFFANQNILVADLVLDANRCVQIQATFDMRQQRFIAYEVFPPGISHTETKQTEAMELFENYVMPILEETGMKDTWIRRN